MSFARPVHFGQHVLAVLAAATLGSAAVTACWTAGLTAVASGRPLGLPMAMLAMACWLGVMLSTLPSAAIVLSALWPVIRRGTTASNWICLLAGMATGISIAPMWSPQTRGVPLSELPDFALAGGGVAVIYVAILRRMGSARPIDAAIFA